MLRFTVLFSLASRHIDRLRAAYSRVRSRLCWGWMVRNVGGSWGGSRSESFRIFHDWVQGAYRARLLWRVYIARRTL